MEYYTINNSHRATYQVTVGNDELQYEAGPFTTFGTKILTRYTDKSDHNSPAGILNIQPYIPDFSVKPLTDVTLLYIPFNHYIVAVKASCAEKDAGYIFEEVISDFGKSIF